MKRKVAIYARVSTEHDVSVMSAKSVIENLDKEKYDERIKICECQLSKFERDVLKLYIDA